MRRACDPLSLTIARSPGPGADDSATMVSSRCGSMKLLCRRVTRSRSHLILAGAIKSSDRPGERHMPRDKPILKPLADLEPHEYADCFALLVERNKLTTREGKPYFACRFRDA